MKILGIDPALHVTGYGLIETEGSRIKLLEAGFIKTPPKALISERLNKLYSAIHQLIVNNSPKTLVLEKIYAHINHPTTAYILGHARGVVCLTASISNVPVIEFAATKVKKAITGRGNATKYQVQRAIQYFLNLKDADWPLDVSDALALALTYANIEKHSLKITK